jgi:UDP-N-acetylmuramoylalanine--D-glutamate ligase
MEDLKNKKVSVLGLGRSGRAVCNLLVSKGAQVFGSDSGEVTIPEKDFDYETGKHSEKIYDSDLIVVSPGIPLDVGVLEEARRREIEIVGEIEVASWFIEGTLIAVTGTNGKTTTSSLIREMLDVGGFSTVLGGNISPGIPLSEAVMKSNEETYIVAEVSTFQLETIKRFRPCIGIITNITPDHLDRHKDFETYIWLKRRLFSNQTQDDYCILNYDQKETRDTENHVPSQVYFFSVKEPVENGAFLSEDEIYVSTQGKGSSVYRREDILLPGMHNVENALAATTACMIVGCDQSAMRKAVMTFSGVPHRLEFVAVIEGIRFINNSMCTNPVAFKRSVESVMTPFVLICGGRNKNLALEKMVDSIRKAKFTVIIGESAEPLARLLQNVRYEDLLIARTMDEAVKKAFEHASLGDTVILSPGGSSFDMFKDFAERGEHFKRSVKRLKNGPIEN